MNELRWWKIEQKGKKHFNVRLSHCTFFCCFHRHFAAKTTASDSRFAKSSATKTKNKIISLVSFNWNLFFSSSSIAHWIDTPIAVCVPFLFFCFSFHGPFYFAFQLSDSLLCLIKLTYAVYISTALARNNCFCTKVVERVNWCECFVSALDIRRAMDQTWINYNFPFLPSFHFVDGF